MHTFLVLLSDTNSLHSVENGGWNWNRGGGGGGGRGRGWGYRGKFQDMPSYANFIISYALGRIDVWG